MVNKILIEKIKIKFNECVDLEEKCLNYQLNAIEENKLFKIHVLTFKHEINNLDFIYEYTELVNKNLIHPSPINLYDTNENLEYTYLILEKNIKYLQDTLIPETSRNYENLHKRYITWNDKLKEEEQKNNIVDEIFKEGLELCNILEN